MLKTAIACALGLGFLFLDAHSKPTLAFLGLSPDSDPRIREKLAGRIRYELAADTGIYLFPQDQVDLLFAKGVIRSTEAGPADMPALSKGLGAQYYASARLEPISVAAKRVWWKPWFLNVVWTQGLRLRILDGADGNLVFDGIVSGSFPEKALFRAPDARMRGMSPLERDRYLGLAIDAVSAESAKALAKVLKEKAAGAAVSPDPGPGTPGG